MRRRRSPLAQWLLLLPVATLACMGSGPQRAFSGGPSFQPAPLPQAQAPQPGIFGAQAQPTPALLAPPQPIVPPNAIPARAAAAPQRGRQQQPIQYSNGQQFAQGAAAAAAPPPPPLPLPNTSPAMDQNAVLRYYLGAPVVSEFDVIGYNSEGGGPVNSGNSNSKIENSRGGQGTALTCNFDGAPCCWANVAEPDDQLDWQVATGRPNSAFFVNAPAPEGSYLIAYAKGAGASDEAHFASCSVSCSSSPITVRVKHWQTVNVLLQVCQRESFPQSNEYNPLLHCQELPFVKTFQTTEVQLPKASLIDIVFVASNFVNEPGELAIIDDIEILYDRNGVDCVSDEAHATEGSVRPPSQAQQQLIEGVDGEDASVHKQQEETQFGGAFNSDTATRAASVETAASKAFEVKHSEEESVDADESATLQEKPTVVDYESGEKTAKWNEGSARVVNFTHRQSKQPLQQKRAGRKGKTIPASRPIVSSDEDRQFPPPPPPRPPVRRKRPTKEELLKNAPNKPHRVSSIEVTDLMETRTSTAAEPTTASGEWTPARQQRKSPKSIPDTAAVTLPSVATLSASCQQATCGFEAAHTCHYRDAHTTQSIRGLTTKFSVVSGQFMNRVTGVKGSSEGDFYAATFLFPREMAGLETSVDALSETTRLRFEYYEGTHGVQLKGCCDSLEVCPFSSDKFVSVEDRTWKMASFECPAGTRKIIFLCENTRTNQGACAIDNIQVVELLGEDASRPVASLKPLC